MQKSISKLIFTGYTGSKNPVLYRLKIQFVELDFSEIKYRSTGGKPSTVLVFFVTTNKTAALYFHLKKLKGIYPSAE